MSQPERSTDAPDQPDGSPAESADSAADRQGPADAATSEQPPDDPLAAAKAEASKIRDQLLRTAADYDNFRKRTRRELEDAQRRGRESVIKDLLPVFDNLERAALHADGAQDVKAVADGLRIVLKQFNDTLDRMGVKRVPTVGSAFDPNVHEAIQHLESHEHPAGVVLNEVQPGYSMGDRLVRAALVVVSKGPPAGDPLPS
jgi:molecular chaperone GrpE